MPFDKVQNILSNDCWINHVCIYKAPIQWKLNCGLKIEVMFIMVPYNQIYVLHGFFCQSAKHDTSLYVKPLLRRHTIFSFERGSIWIYCPTYMYLDKCQICLLHYRPHFFSRHYFKPKEITSSMIDIWRKFVIVQGYCHNKCSCSSLNLKHRFVVGIHGIFSRSDKSDFSDREWNLTKRRQT